MRAVITWLTPLRLAPPLGNPRCATDHFFVLYFSKPEPPPPPRPEYPADTVILHCGFGRGFNAPSLSPFVLKLETYLRVAKINYQVNISNGCSGGSRISPRRGRQLSGGGGGGGRQHTILPNFPKNCMKLKEFGPLGGRPKFYYVDPPLGCRVIGVPPPQNATNISQGPVLDKQKSDPGSVLCTVVVTIEFHSIDNNTDSHSSMFEGL